MSDDRNMTAPVSNEPDTQSKKPEEIYQKDQIEDMGSSTVRSRGHTIHCLTIVGQIEGHQLLPSDNKTTKYEHVMPPLA